LNPPPLSDIPLQCFDIAHRTSEPSQVQLVPSIKGPREWCPRPVNIFHGWSTEPPDNVKPSSETLTYWLASGKCCQRSRLGFPTKKSNVIVVLNCYWVGGRSEILISEVLKIVPRGPKALCTDTDRNYIIMMINDHKNEKDMMKN